MSNEAKRKRRMQMGDADPTGARQYLQTTTSGIPAQPIAWHATRQRQHDEQPTGCNRINGQMEQHNHGSMSGQKLATLMAMVD